MNKLAITLLTTTLILTACGVDKDKEVNTQDKEPKQEQKAKKPKSDSKQEASETVEQTEGNNVDNTAQSDSSESPTQAQSEQTEAVEGNNNQTTKHSNNTTVNKPVEPAQDDEFAGCIPLEFPEGSTGGGGHPCQNFDGTRIIPPDEFYKQKQTEQPQQQRYMTPDEIAEWNRTKPTTHDESMMEKVE